MITAADVHQASILVVDDQKANVMLLERMLQKAGYARVTSTMDPTQVCELHRNNRYDLILLDLQMPSMDGFAVMEGLKEIEAGSYLPVLVTTAQPDHKLRALEAGAKDFVSKPFDLAEVLIRVYNMLEVRLLHRETKQLYDRVVAEQKVSERLLLNVLPQAIAERLKGRLEVTADGITELIADRYESVTVLFADIVEFSKYSASVSVEALVGMLNEIFTAFDKIAADRGLEKIKTIGDAYMAAAGLPDPVSDPTVRAAHMALDMMEAVERINVEKGYKLQVRIGMATGPAMAGVVGKHKFLYDLWGSAVNSASRMETHGMPGRIQLSDGARTLLNGEFALEERGVIEVKGMGAMRTWFLNGRSATLPRESVHREAAPQVNA